MRIVAVYPGRFHPFHKGHAASFKQLVQKFGLDNTYLAISAKQEQPKSPFSAQDRAKMANSLGIPSKNIIAVRNPYGAQEYIDQLNLDPEQTAIVFGVSKKDMEGDAALGIAPDPRFSFKAKKDGSPSYLQPFNPKKVDPLSQHGYVMSTDVAEFPIAGKSMRDASAIRQAYAGADEKTKMRILTDLYGDAAEKMKQVFDNNLQVTETIRRLISAIKPMLGEATIQQKAKFVTLLENAKKALDEVSPGVKRMRFNSNQIDIVKELVDGYVLADESYDDDEGFTKEGFAVYYEEEPNSYVFVDSVNTSPYSRQPGELTQEVKRIIAQDIRERNLNEENKSSTMWVATDVDKDGDTEMSLAKVNKPRANQNDPLVYQGDDPFVRELIVNARKEAPNAKNDIEAVFHVLAKKTQEQDSFSRNLTKQVQQRNDQIQQLEQHIEKLEKIGTPAAPSNKEPVKPEVPVKPQQAAAPSASPYVTESSDYIEEK
jgi:cytidyltransferase-like protein